MEIRLSNRVKVSTIVIAISALIAMTGFLSVSSTIGTVFSICFIIMLAFSLYRDHTGCFLIPRWVLNIISVGVIAFTVTRIDLEDPVVPILEALVMLLSIKLLEDKKFRDYMQIYALSLFLLAGSALVSLDMTFLTYFLTLLVLITLASVFLTYHAEDPTLSLANSTVGRISAKVLLIPVIAAPLTLLLFVVLPRTNYPLLHFLNSPGKAKTGFTDKVTLGEISDIQEDTSVIFRAGMEKIDPGLLYWRGIVLDYFDGMAWRTSKKDQITFIIGITGITGSARAGQIRQRIYLEPYDNTYLFALDTPVSITLLRNLKGYSDHTFTLPSVIQRRITYEAASIASGTIPEQETDRKGYLLIPNNLSAEIHGLVKDLSVVSDKKKTAYAVLDYLQGGRFSYSLQGLPLSRDPLYDFLFIHKRGNCEYFASTMAVMLRIAGIPSRLVGGYKGGYYNEIGNYYLIPQKNAHVWVEAYLTDSGWTRFDPTPVSMEHYTSLMHGDAILKVRIAFDTLSYYWNVFVINYDLQKQISLFSHLKSGIQKPQITLSFVRDLIFRYALNGLLVVGFLCLFYAIFTRRKSREARIISRFFRQMHKVGYKKKPSEGLEEFVKRISDNALKEKALQFVKEFEKNYYRDKKLTKEERAVLNALLRQL